ncbi:MAG: hypothetical protein AAF585_19720 [Verrucomicrobiota bacterium]
MNANIDPVDAFIGGLISPVKVWFITIGIMILAALTMWPAGKNAHPLLLITMVFPLFQWLAHASAALIGILALISIFGFSFYTMQDRLSPKVYVFGVYTSAFVFFFISAIEAGRWWLPLLIYITVALYFWYVWPLMHKQRDRDYRRDRYG